MGRRKGWLDLRKQVIQGLFVRYVADDLSKKRVREQLGQKSVCCTAIPTTSVVLGSHGHPGVSC